MADEGKSNADDIGVIETEDQLKEYMARGGKAAEAGKDGLEGEDEGSEEGDDGEEDGKATNKAGKPAKKVEKPLITDPKDPNFKLPETLDEDEGEEGEEKEEEFTNVVDYLNKEFDLGLNVQELPANMTREQEAETVASVVGKLYQGFQGTIAKYQQLDKLVRSDKDTADFLAARAAGKTLKDIAAEYLAAPEGAPDDVIVGRHIKVMYPTLTEAEVQDQVQTLRDKKSLEKFATSARDYFKNERQKESELAEQERRQQALEEEEEYKKSVRSFGTFLQRTNQVYNVPISPDMKQRVFEAVTIRDEEGLTEHDRLLQSDAGQFMSALGIYYMKNMLKDGASKIANKSKKDFKERLFNEPSRLQSGSEVQNEPDFDANLANTF